MTEKVNPVKVRHRTAVVLSHPTQYFSPWFRHVAANSDIEIKLYYLWDFGVETRHDKNFGHALKWDIPLLDGYEYDFVPNKSSDPGTHHFFGLNNPELAARIDDWHPDAILLFGYTYLSHLRILCSPRFYKIPLLMRGDSHNLYRQSGIKQTIKQLMRKIVFKRFSGFLAVGKANADYFQDCQVQNSKIHFVPHCVDNSRFQSAAHQATQEAIVWRQELGISATATVILFAGKFENKKRPQDLIQAFLSLRSGALDKETALVMIGAGELESELRLQAGVELGRSIFFAPFQNQTQMPKVYALGDVLVLPSFGAGETWGLAVNEAMNLGKPVIVSSHVGCGPDLVKDRGTGWIFEAGDIDALLEAMHEAVKLGREGLACKGIKAKELIAEYSYEAATKSLIGALNGILG